MRYIVRRTGQAFLTVVSVIVLTFVMIRLMPGGPIDYLRAQLMADRGEDQTMTVEQLNSYAEEYLNLTPDAPIYEQLWNYVVSALQGNFGQSIQLNDSVGSIIANSAPWTLFILTLAITFTFAIGIVLGAIMAYEEGTWFDAGWTTISMFLNSVPYFIAALLFLYVLAVQLSWFPQGGNVTPGVEAGLNFKYIHSVFYHATLPVASLVITGAGGIALGMRGNAIKEIGEEYIRVAHLRGVPGRRIAVRYVGRNAVLPLYTQLLISIGFMFGGQVVLEQIFAYPGLGKRLLDAINGRDYPLMMGVFITITVAVVAAVLFADLTYGKIDPRVAGEGSGESY